MNAAPNDKGARMREKDVRNGEAETNPSDFLARYLRSDFPETSAKPSPRQKQMGEEEKKRVDLVKPRSGTSYDNPSAN